ncbi:hypothetical protein BNJ_00225 [Kaumoebavirus]|uniref:hypothetical protein n=1 Tax=Kaumoebavirus TaxID=1859492 RepID=UPI0009C238D3|nr:hypothetical protein BNJ_00225 [Kaumoebavirus]ARA72054.1 hypothetical protein BNJ_00225 [Kaumoebavirus]
MSEYLYYFINSVGTHLEIPNEDIERRETDDKTYLRIKMKGYTFELEVWAETHNLDSSWDEPEDRIHWKWNILELDEEDRGDFKPQYRDDEDEEETTLGIYCAAQQIAENVDEVIYQKEKKDVKNEMKNLFERLRDIVPEDLRADEPSEQLRRIIGYFEAL